MDRSISLFNSQFQAPLAVFGNLGSMGGLRALRQNLCHITSSHLLQEDDEEYNFDYGQGYFFSPAVTAKDIKKQIEQYGLNARKYFDEN